MIGMAKITVDESLVANGDIKMLLGYVAAVALQMLIFRGEYNNTKEDEGFWFLMTIGWPIGAILPFFGVGAWPGALLFFIIWKGNP